MHIAWLGKMQHFSNDNGVVDTMRRCCGKNMRCVCGCTSAGVRLRACRLTYQVCHAQVHIFSAFSLAPPYFSTLLHNGMIFGKKSLNIKCALWFSLQSLFETFLILRRIQRDIVENVKTSSYKVLVIVDKF
jgi:hypothetical protein